MTAGGLVVVCGDDGVAVRVREELAALGVTVLCVCAEQDSRAARGARRAQAEVVQGRIAWPMLWDQLPLERITAVALLDDDDLGNLEAGLLAAERVPGARIVVRLFDAALGSALEELLGENGRAISATEVAAPAFLRAALSGNTGQPVYLDGRELEVAELAAGDPQAIAPLAHVATPADLLDRGAPVEGRILALVARSVEALPPRPRAGRLARTRALLGVAPLRMLGLLGAILTTVVVASTVFALGAALSPVDALYFTVTTVTTVGYGDVNLLDRPAWLKLFDVGLMAVAALLLASFLAFVTDLLISTRIDRALGRYPRPTEGHVVVCGLGKIGSRILAGLDALGVPCVGVERSEDAPGLAVARSLQIPVVIADVRTPEALDGLHLDGARALLAVTDDDLANLRLGISARAEHPALAVVLRLFDPRLAERVDQGLGFDVSRSVASLAAPAFAAALLDRPLSQPLPLSSLPLRTLEIDAPEATTVAELEHADDLRVLSCGGAWPATADEQIAAGAPLAVVGTRDACDRLLRASLNG